MAEHMRIGALAGRAGVADSTIRFYERERLLQPDGRTAGNYRYYGPQALARLTFIRAAQASGLSLDDIRILLGFQDGKISPCRDVQRVVEQRLEQVEDQLRHLRRTRKVLRAYREACEETGRGESCPVLDDLRHHS